MPSNEYLLVMTACIDPSAGHHPPKRADPAIRLGDYKNALRFWLAYPDDRIRRILFIENSGYPLDSLQSIAAEENPRAKATEFISLDCNWYPKATHYGYAEMRMLDLGLQQSHLRGETTHMIKATGRLTFPALSKLLDKVPDDFDFVADARIWRAPWRKYRIAFISTQLILFRHNFYAEHLQSSYDEMVETHDWSVQRPLVEPFLYRKLVSLPASANHPRLLRFPCSADPVGQPAHRSRSYSHVKQRITNAFRALMRRLAPGWWL